MKKLLFLMLAIFISQFLFCSALYDFTYYFLKQNKVPEQHAVIMAKVLDEETKIVPSIIDPLFILAFGLTETGFVNTFGDNGKAVGYFQIHENAVFYVANFYQDVREFKAKHRSHADLIRYPDWQLRIAYRYIFLSLKNIHGWDITKAISAYNGRRDKYNEYTVKFFKNYSEIIRQYMNFNQTLAQSRK
ncbi:MAG: hypothetical protein ACP5KD_02480 [Fervidobacterium sp.]